MSTLEKIRAEIQKVLDKERDFTSENAKAQAIALNWVLALFDKYAEQSGWEEMTVPCENCGHDMTFKIAAIGDCEDCKYKSMAGQEPTIPCDLCGFNTGEFCEYLSVCPAIGKAVSK